jgi:hypothetical protein
VGEHPNVALIEKGYAAFGNAVLADGEHDQATADAVLA